MKTIRMANATATHGIKVCASDLDDRATARNSESGRGAVYQGRRFYSEGEPLGCCRVATRRRGGRVRDAWLL